jgi:hypothetical protein
MAIDLLAWTKGNGMIARFLKPAKNMDSQLHQFSGKMTGS